MMTDDTTKNIECKVVIVCITQIGIKRANIGDGDCALLHLIIQRGSGTHMTVIKLRGLYENQVPQHLNE